MVAHEGKKDIKEIVIDTNKYIPDMPTERLVMIRYEFSNLKKKYDRELAITFMATNFASNKHLAITALHGMGDTAINGYIDQIISDIDAELEKRDQ